MPEFKENFIKDLENITDIEKFKEYTLKPLRKSIRINNLKISVKNFKLKNFKLTKIPYIPNGFFITGERTDLGNLIEHSLGYFYVQEAASMIPPVVLNPKENEIVLDLCASPGSKTTQMAAMMNNKGLIFANDLKFDRIRILHSNLQRCGVSNTVITLMEGHKFSRSNIKFDKILVDAPCSGSGAIRKSLHTLKIWNSNMLKKLSSIQKQLLKTAFELLKKNGTLVYSTCSICPEENEAVVDYLLKEFPNAKVENIKLKDLKLSPCILKYKNETYSEEIKKCLRLWPQDNDTEGFFIAKIKKT